MGYLCPSPSSGRQKVYVFIVGVMMFPQLLKLDFLTPHWQFIPSLFLVKTSLIPFASQQYRVHLGYCQRSYLGSALCFCRVGSATIRVFISLCSFLGENLDFLKFRYIALYISSKSESCYCYPSYKSLFLISSTEAQCFAFHYILDPTELQGNQLSEICSTQISVCKD